MSPEQIDDVDIPGRSPISRQPDATVQWCSASKFADHLWCLL